MAALRQFAWRAPAAWGSADSRHGSSFGEEEGFLNSSHYQDACQDGSAQPAQPAASEAGSTPHQQSGSACNVSAESAAAQDKCTPEDPEIWGTEGDWFQTPDGHFK